MIDSRILSEAYIYLIGRALVARQEQIDAGSDGFAYNRVTYNPLGSADFVNPNFDVAYLEAWIAVDAEHPVILEVPEITGRYYTAQILDEWGEVIVNINERTFPSKPFGRFALTMPGSARVLPPRASRIDLHSAKAKLLARVELKGDPEGALALQKKFKLTPQGAPVVAPAPDLPVFGNDTLIRQTIVPDFKNYVFTQAAPEHDYWVGAAPEVGHYGVNYWLRAAVNYAGIWANTADEAIYFTANRDIAGKRLDGGSSYVMHFPADRLPESAAQAYWSVILVDATDFRVVKNPLNRFNLNNQSPLQKEPGGSLKIALGPAPVEGVPEANWLPSPEGKPYSLTLRAYVPKDAVKRGEWTPPGVRRV